jgi:HD-like signal output (HDOD) protein
MKNILFVDDEAELLNSLRARLRKHRSDWNMTFVDSGEKALQELQKQPIDLIVSDVRMPGMDGGELLTVVKQRWPETIRIVLSGYSEQAQVLRLTMLAQQYISKPCNAQQLENIIERCFQLHSLLSSEKVRAIVGRVGKLPVMPKVFARLQEAIAQPNINMNTVSDIVSADAAIATKVLQIANSAFFRLSKPISGIKQAVTYLGIATLRNLVLSAEIFEQWKTPKDFPQFDADRLQRHALMVAAACKSLTVPGQSDDDAWMVGLVHDIGYWVLVQESPMELLQALTQARSTKVPAYEVEQQIIGATHAEIGAYLLGMWGLPYPVVEAVAMHHTPQRVAQQGYDLLALLATAHSLLPKHGAHALLDELDVPPPVDESYLAGLHAPFSWQEAEQRVEASQATL